MECEALNDLDAVVRALDSDSQRQNGTEQPGWAQNVFDNPLGNPLGNSPPPLFANEDFVDGDDNDLFAAFSPDASTAPNQSFQQHTNVTVPPFISPSISSSHNPMVLGVQTTTVLSHLSTATEEGGPTTLAVPANNGAYIYQPWNNPDYTALIQWVLHAPKSDLNKPFEKTVPAVLLPSSWKGFRKDDVKCEVSMGGKLKKSRDDPRYVLDAKNLFIHHYTDGMKLPRESWVFLCPACREMGFAKSFTSHDKLQFETRPASHGKRQYSYKCTSCNFEHQNFTPTKLLQTAFNKAITLEMDLYEYFLGDYDHVVNQIKDKLSNLDEIERDLYDCDVKQTRLDNYLPFMGLRIIETNKKEPKKTKSSQSRRMPTGSGSLPMRSLPMPFGAGSESDAPSNFSQNKRKKGEQSFTVPKQHRYSELFWSTTIHNIDDYKQLIDSGTLTEDNFDLIFNGINSMVIFHHINSTFVLNGVPKNYKDFPDDLNKLRTCAHQAIARLFSDTNLVSPDVRDYAMSKLALRDEEITAILPMRALLEAGIAICSPTTAAEFASPTPSVPIASRKSPLNSFRPVNRESPSNSNVIHCVCATAPNSGTLIQCCLCSQWSHRVCYCINTDDDIKNWCCMHCKPTVYQNLTEGTIRPLKLDSSLLICECGDAYPCPKVVPNTKIDYDDTIWLQCRNGSCGRMMHSKCYNSRNCQEVQVFCSVCQALDD